MAFPSFFIIFIIIIVVFQHKLRKSNNLDAKRKQEYWQKEQSSLVVRKKEFEASDYIQPDISKLSFVIPTNIDDGDRLHLKQVINSIQKLSKEDMMNFSHLTNTEVRLTFGTANQTVITNNEQNYHLFLKALASYAHIQTDYQNYSEAILALEECIRLHSDYKDHFISLGELYVITEDKLPLTHLIEVAKNLESLNKKGILEKLDSLD